VNAGTTTDIAMEPGLEALCRRHPEMGPCRYERDACRKQGGVVTNGAGTEVTAATEAAYDKRVMRVTLQSDGAPATTR
jgi:hypothetical protein